MNPEKKEAFKKFLWELLSDYNRQVEFIECLDLSELIHMCCSFECTSTISSFERLRLIRKFNDQFVNGLVLSGYLKKFYHDNPSIRKTMLELGIAKESKPINHHKLWNDKEVEIALMALSEACKSAAKNLDRTPLAVLKKIQEIL